MTMTTSLLCKCIGHEKQISHTDGNLRRADADAAYDNDDDEEDEYDGNDNDNDCDYYY